MRLVPTNTQQCVFSLLTVTLWQGLQATPTCAAPSDTTVTEADIKENTLHINIHSKIHNSYINNNFNICYRSDSKKFVCLYSYSFTVCGNISIYSQLSYFIYYSMSHIAKQLIVYASFLLCSAVWVYLVYSNIHQDILPFDKHAAYCTAALGSAWILSKLNLILLYQHDSTHCHPLISVLVEAMTHAETFWLLLWAIIILHALIIYNMFCIIDDGCYYNLVMKHF